MIPANREHCGFYFALPRLIGTSRGYSSDKSEVNSTEAYLGSIVIFAVTYFFLIDLVPAGLSGWKHFFVWAVLVLAVWIFWLIVLYFNSLIIRGLRICGLLRKTTERRTQDFFIVTLTTLFAVELSIHNSWTRWIGITCLLLVGANLAAALLLPVTGRRRGTTN